MMSTCLSSQLMRISINPCRWEFPPAAVHHGCRSTFQTKCHHKTLSTSIIVDEQLNQSTNVSHSSPNFHLLYSRVLVECSSVVDQRVITIDHTLIKIVITNDGNSHHFFLLSESVYSPPHSAGGYFIRLFIWQLTMMMMRLSGVNRLSLCVCACGIVGFTRVCACV